jgi:deferrochelatase/peroxidase EfeB
LADADGVQTPGESGARLFDDGGVDGRRDVEHFGFRDGIAGLRFLPPEPGSVLKPGDSLPELFPLRHVLRPLPRTALGAAGSERFGSFLVFRKLEEKVDVFENNIARIASDLLQDPTNAGLERARAWVVGRFRDGSPLAVHSSPAKDDSNDFTFTHPVDDSGSGGGRRCPFHAHIRKMNPRGDHGDEAVDPRERLPVRRSMPYGNRVLSDPAKRILDITKPPAANEPVGLLFMAFVADIEKQFEHVIKAWSNGAGFPWPAAPVDAVMGRTTATTVAVPGPVQGGSAGSAPFDRCIFARGGAYLFAPPWTFFDDLKAGRIP